MSTLDPGLEPPGDWQSPHAPPPPQGRTDATDRAAVFVWLCAGVGFFMTCCCMTNAIAAMLQPRMIIDQFLAELPPELEGYDMTQLVMIMSIVMMVVYVLMLLIPSFVLVLMGFGVRSGGRWQITAAKALTLYFALLAGIGVLMGLVGMASAGVIIAVIQLLIFGGWLWLTLAAFSALRTASQSAGGDGPIDPWGE